MVNLSNPILNIYRMITKYEAMYYSDVVAGALVVNIDPTGPAVGSGLKRGDIITKVNGEEVVQSFAYLVQSHKVGEEITLTVWSEGNSREVKIKLGEAN